MMVLAPPAAPVVTQELAAPPAPPPVVAAAAASPVTKEASPLEVLKSDPTVKMQAIPKDLAANPAPHDLPAKPEPMTAKAPEKKAIETTPAAKPAAAPSPAPPSKVAAAPAPAATPKVATTAPAAPKLITVGARTPASPTAIYVQAGSFPTQDRAGQIASTLDSMGARVMPGTVDGHAVYRVRIGPFLNVRQANAAIEQAHSLGHADLVIVTE
jgi:cell division protein FtsN